jgi:hypothetical protein
MLWLWSFVSPLTVIIVCGFFVCRVFTVGLIVALRIQQEITKSSSSSSSSSSSLSTIQSIKHSYVVVQISIGQSELSRPEEAACDSFVQIEADNAAMLVVLPVFLLVFSSRSQSSVMVQFRTLKNIV